MSDQLDLLASGPAFPAGFRYEPDLLAGEEEEPLLERIRELPFREFEFRGYTGKRRVVSFGWEYDFGDSTLRSTDEIPDFLLPVRDRAAAFAGIAPERLPHVLLTEYGPGAAIGWHRDRGVFGQVIGVSLLSPCVFRLRRKSGTRWERVSLTVAPRSVYLLSGPARTEWEHSIPAVEALRYSITFRTLASDRAAGDGRGARASEGRGSSR